MTNQTQTVLSLARKGPVTVYGASPSYLAYLATQLASMAASMTIIIVTNRPDDARSIGTDLRFFCTGTDVPHFDAHEIYASPVLHIPPADTSRYADLASDHGALMQRLSALHRLTLAPQASPKWIVVCMQSLLQLVPPKTDFAENTSRIAVEQELDRDQFCEYLSRIGFRNTPLVQDPGTFSARGGIVDIFSPAHRLPVRVELLGDQVESIRTFDPATQHTLRSIDVVHVHQVRETVKTRGANPRAKLLAAADATSHPSKATAKVLRQIESGEEFYGIDALTPAFHNKLAPLQTYLRDNEQTYWLLDDPEILAETGKAFLEQENTNFERRKAEHRLAFPPPEHYASLDQLSLLRSTNRRIEFRRLEGENHDDQSSSYRIRLREFHDLSSKIEHARRTNADDLLRPFVETLHNWIDNNWKIGISCASKNRAQQLQGLLSQNEVDVDIACASTTINELVRKRPTVFPKPLTGGFCDPIGKIAVLTEDIVFGPRRRTTSRQTAARKRALKALAGDVADFSKLSPGDYIVHTTHGIGVYRGLVQLPMGADRHDFLHVEYRDGMLYLPIYRLEEVRCYVGTQGHSPSIDKLGGATWTRKHKSVSRNVRGLAEDLLQLYAQRQEACGTAFPPADTMFREFEATFAFEETPDQKQAIEDVLADMESPSPMDRLVCGDVGHGKTEVALRACLKAVMGGKQVAFLAPTTVLVEQHYQTFMRRFAGWPVRIARISRFQSRKLQSETIVSLANGTVDAVIGTHRLLSRDVRFKELGLLIVDEEQRFGVTHKERIRKTRAHIDTLTLTATPIPRTLHLAMAGMRDLSIIATPPVDRHSIRTYVSRPADQTLTEGIRRELARRGQVFFVAPRIDGQGASLPLSEWATRLGQLVPEARIAVAHGQLPTQQLEQTMIDFVTGAYDVLVCTTIVENGIDIPSANTMFIADADSFGLAQLYQLRGRIGRGSVQAFCYLLVSHPNLLSTTARKRLEALQRFTELGSGFQIASHDLEIRGAGDLFGARQSGSIAAVGFDTYLSLLREAVDELREIEPTQRRPEPEINIPHPGFIPDDYIPDVGQRLGFYKQLSSAEDSEQVSSILSSIEDRYGPLRIEVEHLGALSAIRAHARRLGVQTLELTQTRINLALAASHPLDATKLANLVNNSKHYRITADQRLQRMFTQQQQTDPVAAAHACLLELTGCATNTLS